MSIRRRSAQSCANWGEDVSMRVENVENVSIQAENLPLTQGFMNLDTQRQEKKEWREKKLSYCWILSSIRGSS